MSEALAVELQPLGIRVTVVESGCLPTAFINTRSFAISARKINDYRDTSGALRGVGADMNHAQRDDPSELADALLQLIDTPNPPLRLTLRDA